LDSVGAPWRPPPGTTLTCACPRREFARKLFTSKDISQILAAVEDVLSETVGATAAVLDAYDPLLQSFRELFVFLKALKPCWPTLHARNREQRMAEQRQATVQDRLRCVSVRLDRWHSLWHTRPCPRHMLDECDGQDRPVFGQVPGLPAAEAIFAPAADALQAGGILEKLSCGCKLLERAEEAEAALWTALGTSLPRQRLWKLDNPVFHHRVAGIIGCAFMMVAKGDECNEATQLHINGVSDEHCCETWSITCSGPLSDALEACVGSLDVLRAQWADIAPYAPVVDGVYQALATCLRSDKVLKEVAQISSLDKRQKALDGIWHSTSVLRESVGSINEWKDTVVSCRLELLSVQGRLGMFTSLGARARIGAQRCASPDAPDDDKVEDSHTLQHATSWSGSTFA